MISHSTRKKIAISVILSLAVASLSLVYLAARYLSFSKPASTLYLAGIWEYMQNGPLRKSAHDLVYSYEKWPRAFTGRTTFRLGSGGKRSFLEINEIDSKKAILSIIDPDYSTCVIAADYVVDNGADGIHGTVVITTHSKKGNFKASFEDHSKEITNFFTTHNEAIRNACAGNDFENRYEATSRLDIVLNAD